MAVKRGEVYFADLNPVTGREQAGTRPVLLVSSDDINALPLVITVVVGTRGERVKRDYPTNVRVAAEESGLPHETVFLCFQIRSLDEGRLIQLRAGVVDDDVMDRVDAAVRYCLRL